MAILRRKDLSAATGLARSTIYCRINPRSPYFDPTFPHPIPLGGAGGGLVGVRGFGLARSPGRETARLWRGGVTHGIPQK